MDGRQERNIPSLLLAMASPCSASANHEASLTKYKASKSVGRPISFTSEGRINWFWGSKAVKCVVGKLVSRTANTLLAEGSLFFSPFGLQVNPIGRYTSWQVWSETERKREKAFMCDRRRRRGKTTNHAAKKETKVCQASVGGQWLPSNYTYTDVYIY